MALLTHPMERSLFEGRIVPQLVKLPACVELGGLLLFSQEPAIGSYTDRCQFAQHPVILFPEDTIFIIFPSSHGTLVVASFQGLLQKCMHF